MQDILMPLNPEQKQAASIKDGPVLIVAGPGSGKTKVLTHRIAWLIEQGVAPENILAITFTNKAADEIRQRTTDLLGKKLKSQPEIGTFHALCARLLRQEAKALSFGAGFIIYDEKDSLSLIKKTMKGLDISDKEFQPGAIQNAISRAKNELIDADDYSQKARDFYPQVVARVYQRYQENLEKIKALDFDDLIFKAVRLLEKNPEILKKYQKKFKYILVDEYQDTNYSQYVFTQLLAQQHQNIFVIGDADQSIYAWRGADFRNILNFEKDYPKAKIVFLEKNYRSTQKILDAAHHIIVKNLQRQDKNLLAQKPKGPPLTIYEASDERGEALFVAENILNLSEKKRLGFNSFVVLYRTNAQSRTLEEIFLESELPYKIVGGMKFYDRKEIKDLLAYLRIIQRSSDIISLERIKKLPRKARAFENLEKTISNLRRLSLALPTSKLLENILKETGYQEYLLDGTPEGETRWENVRELLGVAQKYDNLEPGSALESFLEKTALAQNHDEVQDKKNLINLMTLHCVKGLEFPIVFITGLEEGLLPHQRSFIDQNQLEEERRLCYVGVTRAKEKVFLSYARQRELYGGISVNAPSRFLDDIPKELTKFKRGIL